MFSSNSTQKNLNIPPLDTLTNVTLKMINNMTIDEQRRVATLKGIVFTNLILIARKYKSEYKEDIGYIYVCDDTGYRVLQIMLISDKDKTLFQNIHVDDSETCYYKFLLKIRIHKGTLNFDIIHISFVNKYDEILNHFMKIGTIKKLIEQKQLFQITSQDKSDIINNNKNILQNIDE